MEPIYYIDRATQKKEVEDVYGADALKFLYGKSFFSCWIGRPLLHLFIKRPWFSSLYGWWQRQSWTKKKIAPFIAKYGVDASEFEKSVDQFVSFDDFFTRKLKKEARPIAPKANVSIIPADARYLFYPEIDRADGFIVKGAPFNLETLLKDRNLAEKYHRGSMVVARLCPTDYHRFHFPFDCVPGTSRLINGQLLSVNPIALTQNSQILFENKRVVTVLETTEFGTVQYIEIGATNVGSIIQTFKPGQFYEKGAEKGYFSFGASSLILLFEPGSLSMDHDLLLAMQKRSEVRCLLGQSMGNSNKKSKLF